VVVVSFTQAARANETATAKINNEMRRIELEMDSDEFI